MNYAIHIKPDFGKIFKFVWLNFFLRDFFLTRNVADPRGRDEKIMQFWHSKTFKHNVLELKELKGRVEYGPGGHNKKSILKSGEKENGDSLEEKN